MKRTVQLAPLSIRAEVAAGSASDEARTVELIFSTSAPVERYDWMSGKRYLESLSFDPAHVRIDRLNAGASLLDSHSTYSVGDILGAVEPGSVVLKKKEGRVKVRFSKRDAVEPIWQDVKDGIIHWVSVGYKVYEYQEVAGKGDAPSVRTAVDWEPFEVSMVPIPADAGAHVRGDGIQTHPCVIVTRGLEDTMTPEEIAEQARLAALAAVPPPTVTVAITPEETRADATTAERFRATAIRKAVTLARLPATVADDLVSRGVTLDAARGEILDKLATASEGTTITQHVRAGDDSRDKWISGVRAWILQRAGMTDMVRQAQAAKPNVARLQNIALDPGEFRGLSLLDLARESVERSGRYVRGLDKMDIAGLALRDITGVQTTSDFTVALESVLDKTLLAAYAITPDTWRQFCSVGSVVDFRPHPRYRSGFMSRLAEVPEGAEFTNKNIPNATKESITATTKGNIISLSRQAIVNDDMGVFSRVAQQAGRAAALSIEMDVYDLLLLNAGLGPLMNDGVAMFNAAHNNIGAPAAISVASIDADRVLLASQKDASLNEILDIRPGVLVLPIGLGGAARVMNTSQYDTDIVANKFLVPNKVVGLFRAIVDTPRLTGTRRYMFADPTLFPVIEVAFLDGVQEPFLDTQEGWRIDGTEWKVRLDYGVAAIEFRGAITNAGV